MNRMVKFARLPWRRRGLLIRCWLALNATAVAVRMLPLQRVLALMGTNQAAAERSPRFTREELAWTVRAAAALSWKPTCAVRGLVAERLLRLDGHIAQFRVGVVRDEDFQAHAWVEDAEGVFVGESERSYQALPDLG